MTKALVCAQLGSPVAPVGAAGSALQLQHVPSAACQPKSVRLRVVAAALNFADALIVQGKYQEKPTLPFIPGGEVSGVVTEVGSNVKTLSVGDSVVAVLVAYGGFATEVVVRAADCTRVTPTPLFTLEQAAALPVAYGTAHVALKHRCSLLPGQTVLVLGAAGGVGLAAVQLGRLLGARVIAVARGTVKCAALREEGADLVIDSSSLDKHGLRGPVSAFAPRGVDVLFDAVGGDLFKDAMRTLGWGARVAIIGFASGSIPSLAANVLLVKNVTVHGIYWGSYAKHDPATLRDSLRQLLGWASEGRLRVRIHAALPLEQAHLAFGALLERRAIGKVILLPSSPKL